MNDVRVRKAFNMAIDKVGAGRFERTVKPLTAFTPEGIFPGLSAARRAIRSIRSARKRCSPRPDIAMPPASTTRRHSRSTMSRSPTTPSESNRQIAEFVQAQWKQNLGLTVPLKNMEWKTFLDIAAKLEYKGWRAAGWVGDYMDPYTFLDLFCDHDGRQRHRMVATRNTSRMLRRGESQTRIPQSATSCWRRPRQMLLDAQPMIPLYDERDQLDEEAVRQGDVSAIR